MTNDPSKPPQPANSGADKRSNLADPRVVERILISLAREAIGCRLAAARGIISDHDAEIVSGKEIEQRTLIFLSRDKNYATVEEWNVPGKIDVSLARKMGLDGKGPESIVRGALERYVAEIVQVVNLPENPNISESQWKEKTRDVVARYRDLFVGLRSTAVEAPVAQTSAEVVAPAPVAPALPSPKPLAKTETAVTQKYLGDPPVIDRLLNGLALAVLKTREAATAEIISGEDAAVIEKKEIEDYSAIFLGRNTQYAVDANWNAPGVMDAFLAEQLEITERGPENILQAVLAKFVDTVGHKIHPPDSAPVPEDQWTLAISDIVAVYRNLLLGLPAEVPSTAEEINSDATTTAAAMPDWLQEQVKPAAPVPLTFEPPKPWTEKTDSEQEIPHPVEPAAPRSSRGSAWKWGVLAIVIVGLIATTIMFLPRAPKVVEKKAEPVVVVAKKEPARPKVFMLKNGRIVTADGKEIKSQRAGGNSADNGEEFAEGGQSKALEFWYDVNSASGTARFLVAVKEDPSFSPEFDAPEAWDLWLTDEDGNERFIHKSVFRAKFSPDGTKIVYATSGCVLHVEDLEGKSLAKTYRAYEPNWSGDGKVIVFEQVPEGVALYPAQGFQLARFDWEANQVEVIADGRFDDVIPHVHPSGNWVLFVSGERTGGSSFWKVPAVGGQPVQLTNLRMNEVETQTVPTPYKTALWSSDGKWFLFDFKIGAAEETWGLEFDDNGAFKRAVKLSDGLSPQWTGPTTFVCQKRSGEGFEMVPESLPGS